MKLTDTAIKAAQPREKNWKLRDGQGLYLLITIRGSRLWRYKYRFAKLEKVLAIGRYPEVSLRQAREAKDDARRQLRMGIDPSAAKKTARAASAETFEGIAAEWLETRRRSLSPSTFEKKKQWLTELVFPFIGSKPITTVTSQDIWDLLRKVEARGLNETTHRVRSLCGNVFKFAMATGRAQGDVTAVLPVALAPVVTRNRSAITYPVRVGDLLRAIDGYRGQPATRAALRLAPLTFVRPGELRFAEWREFSLDGENPEWRIPAPRMKMKREHVVPLAKQSVEILRELRAITGKGALVFPSLRANDRPISENTVNAALRTLGFGGDEITGHGFRAMASTLLNEQSFPPEVIELQLAHEDRNKVRAAYNRSTRMPERRRMMQHWADYLDSLRQNHVSRSSPPSPAQQTERAP